MKTDLIDLLVCPDCESPLRCESDSTIDGEILNGQLRCNNGHGFPISRGIPRFVDADAYADSFSKQRLYVRRHFRHYEHDRSGDARFTPSTGIPLSDLNQGVSLEIGCGYGRYLDVVQRHGGQIVGVDLSTHSVELAYDFVGRQPGVHIVQCDLFKMPFRRQSFANVFSLGVLHHTPDTEQAFKAIVPYAAADGRVAIWVYHPDRKRVADRWRRYTTRFPHSALYSWCIVNQAAFSWIRALPGGHRFSRLIPGAAPKRGGSNFWQRVMSDFDSLSPEYAHSHREDEVKRWFREAGLDDVEVLDFPTAVCGVQPATERTRDAEVPA
ncbi:methyltransferase domain-containing protein [Roseiconus nitratireducens]|uniref:Methyltransferase domain-containing protein n=1 Tax=Roseiconus nitratireducens TaxID=2605748 RepID=A0A5M6DFD8_9BACT|nr:methyltransferase domain-containing protein [Roseiconus nitratireducens]KAA5546284.1 methyltransferase domain-containing protein [Roseiconus nitratireducens]